VAKVVVDGFRTGNADVIRGRLGRTRAELACAGFALLALASSACGAEARLVAASAASAPAGAKPTTPAAVAGRGLDRDSAVMQLGQTLFFDARLSRDGSTSCATCHQPAHYFSDGLATSRGVGGAVGSRNAPSLLNVAQADSQFWDGRVRTLEEQALAPMLNPREMAMADLDAVVDAVRRAPEYAGLFSKAYGVRRREDFRIDLVARALSAYERSLTLADSPFDRQIFGGEVGALSPQAERGRQLFMGPAACASCHEIGHDGASFTDNRFHSLSVGLRPIADRLAPLTLQVADLRRQGRSPDAIVLADRDFAALGRFVVTLDPVDLGAFRTPSLRNVARTAPYMHDGSVATLEEAVDDEVYYRSSENGRPLLLTPAERADLVAFLQSLTTPLHEVLAKSPPSSRGSVDVTGKTR
jgi:cytochrome c peroxidase